MQDRSTVAADTSQWPATRPTAPVASPTDVAVVIPSRNRPELLARALRSVLGQSSPPGEIALVDVGGRSRSEALRDLCARTPVPVHRVTLPEPAYAGRARNAGVQATSAPFLAFLDDDDSWHPDYLSQACDVLRNEPAGLVVTPLLVRRSGAVLQLPRIPDGLRADDALASNPGVTGSNIVLAREVLARVGGFDERLAAFNDLDLLVRLLDAGVPLVQAPRPFAEQLIHELSQATEPSALRLSALALYAAKYQHRLSRMQRRALLRERHWMQARLAPTPRTRYLHRAAQICLSTPVELVQTAARRRFLQREPPSKVVA